ncbi:MAG: hypothetical protein K8U57_16095 [Planctomycetes bacterium]|nr:hypothetical protein [Planctomycetota bacterium]
MTLPLARFAALAAAFAIVSSVRAQAPLPPPGQLQPLPPPEKAQDPLPPPRPVVQPEPGVKVLDRGPVHEAFAQPGAEVRGQGMTAPKAPPAPIPELPPETKPDGQNVQWISGYWMWSDDQKDFVWVSGFWRNAPAGRAWSAGQWKQVGGQWAYLPGTWRATDQNSWRIDLPKPPESVENGPSTPASNPNGLWIPGAWEFRNEQYVWRPGYWANPNGNQMWVPSQYVATAYGYMYVPGYWDYPLENRGILNPSVAFTQPLWQTPGWAYQSQYAVGLGSGNGWGSGGLFSSLYIGPNCNNYYYGNYGGYGNGWLGIGFGYSPFWGLGGYGGYVPWYGTHRGYYNPLWNHYCYLNRTHPGYANHVGNVYAGRAIGVPHPGATHVHPTHPTGIGGAAQTAVRSATSVVHPMNVHSANLHTPNLHVGNATATHHGAVTHPHSLVQPTQHVAHSIAATSAAHGLATHNHAMGGSGVNHQGLTITPHYSGVGQVHQGVAGTHPSITGVYPSMHSGTALSHPGYSTPQIHYGTTGVHPGTVHYGTTGVHPGTVHYGTTGVHPGTMHYGTTGVHPGTMHYGSTIHPGYSGSFHSAPSFHSGSSMHGGHISGGHSMGGHSMGGHSGGHGGGHR